MRRSAAGPCLALLLASTSAHAASCESLKQLGVPNTRITVAEDVAPNPEWPYPPSLFVAVTHGPKGTDRPFCRVAGVIDQEIRFETWLPRDWNGRFEAVGNGGLTGAINYPAMGHALAEHYATASTDTGHVTEKGFFESDWVVGHPQRVIDFGYRAHHLLAETAKQIIAAYYGKPAEKNYFNGCSSGGWEGLSEAQRYPDDYNGIVAGAPAINFVRLQSRGISLAGLSIKDPAGDIPKDKAKLLVDSAIARCDAQDGVKDGVIEDPPRCDFDPAQIQCRAGDQPDCLTPAQVKRAKLVYGPLKSPGGMQLYPGSAWGAPPSVDIPGPPLDQPMMLLALAKKPDWTAATFDPDKDIPALEQELGPTLDTENPDLKPFEAKGGKLLLYHGWADGLLSPYNTIDYFERVEQAVGGGAKAATFVRLFMVPGMGHCEGGPGTDTFDKMAVISKWVEEGEAPERIEAAHLTDGKPDKTRPLCRYPAVARYKGSGSTDETASFSCAPPG